MRPGSKALSVFTAWVVCLILSACSGESQPPLVAADIVITEPLPGQQVSAGYVSLTNNSKATIRISRITSPEFASVEIHESILDNGIARMRKMDELLIVAESTVSLQRGGKHLMLMRPNASIDKVSLSFFSGDTLLLEIESALTPRNN